MRSVTSQKEQKVRKNKAKQKIDEKAKWDTQNDKK
jgi:hypothetical protein